MMDDSTSDSGRGRAVGERWLIAGAVFSFGLWLCWSLVGFGWLPLGGTTDSLWVLLALPLLGGLPAFVGGLYIFSARKWPVRLLAAYMLMLPVAGIPGFLGAILGFGLASAV